MGELTTAQYAATQGISTRTVRRHAASGRLASRWDGRRYLIEAGDPLADLMDSLAPEAARGPALRVLPDLIQGTPEWHEQRRGMVTASVVRQLVTPTLKVAANTESRAVTALLVAERITGHVEETYVGDDMLRGWADEPRAVAAYEKHRGVTVTACGFMVREEDGWQLGYSPDGLVGDEGLVEIKSRQPKKHLATILADAVPAENLAQIQAGLLVSGRAWCDYVSYCGGMALWIKRVYPDPAWAVAITEAMRAFEDAAARMTETYHRAVEGLPMTERVIEMEITF